ncbi:MAG: Methyl-accepting chemotaxis protein [uncultured Sulfurovum sp.]|uniref:Methyl-accepting chemotaxis protein n=1 Tax=uncultured Sulfurovum sp. TaxID=269237 RepID=A0A6S6T0B6_9BACT|nr:MAG: Methyl-accepting chemotaxis protein [uncultured Sulfurovum sp.]
MKKSDIVHKIRLARLAHVKWVQRAKSLVNDMPIKEEDIPLTSDSCEFGKWFYLDGQILLTIFNERAVKEVEDLHNKLHDEYVNIFKIYFDLSNIGFFTRLLNNRKKVSDEEKKWAKYYLNLLEETSNALIKKLNIMETKINMADEKLFEKYA